MLQTRNGKRTGEAAIKIAVDMVKEGMITKQEAILKVEPKQLDQLLHPTFDKKSLSAATKVAEGKPCNKDSFTHCIHIYEKYENILEENNMENGEVEISMEIINDAYKQKLKDGF